jgi:hypothetical protein
MAARFQPLLALLLLLVGDAVAMTAEIDRPHKEIRPPVVLSKKSDDGEGDEGETEAAAADEAGEAESEETSEESSEEESAASGEEATEAPKEETTEAPTTPEGHVELPPSHAAFYGPGGCVATFRSPDGTCVMQTRCAEQKTDDYEYGLTCVDDKGVSTRHLFGAGSFDAVETFDTLIKCDLCLGVDTGKATPEVKELADDVFALQNEMKVLKDDVDLIKDKLEATEETTAPPAEDEDTAAPAEEEAEETTAAPASGFLHKETLRKKKDAPLDPSKLSRKVKHVQRARPGKNHPIAAIH